jgi:hypothetical protein
MSTLDTANLFYSLLPNINNNMFFRDLLAAIVVDHLSLLLPFLFQNKIAGNLYPLACIVLLQTSHEFSYSFFLYPSQTHVSKSL